MALDADHVLRDIGQFGPSQWRILGIFFFMFIPITYQTLIMVFVAFEPPWMCTANSTSCILANANGLEVFSTATNPKELYERRCDLNRTDWRFAEHGMYEGPHSTIVSEWDLVCSRGSLAWLTNSMLFFGWALGALILGTLSDWFGRRIILFASCLVLIITSFAMSFSQTIWVLAFCRFIIGFFEPGTGPTMFVYATELVGPLKRALSGTLLWFYFTFALAIMTLQAYYIRDWRMLSIICSAPYIFIMIFWMWVPESVRWLLVHGHKDRARKVLEGVAKMNKKEMPKEELHIPAYPKSKGCLELFSSWHLTKITLIQCYAWFVNGMVYYGVSFSAGDFGGSIYLNFLLTSLVEVPANVFLIWSCNRFGRKKSVVWSFFAGALVCIATSFIPAGTNNTGYIAGRVTGGMLGKFFISISFNSIYIFSAELFPTLVRNSGMGLVSVVCRIGGALAPFVVQLIRVHPVLPFAVMGGLTFLAALLCLMLPETNGKPTVEVFKESGDENAQGAIPLHTDGSGPNNKV